MVWSRIGLLTEPFADRIVERRRVLQGIVDAKLEVGNPAERGLVPDLVAEDPGHASKTRQGPAPRLRACWLQRGSRRR